jgi:hypothetical protein
MTPAVIASGDRAAAAVAARPPKNAIRTRAPWSPFLNFLKIGIFKFQKIPN